MYKSLPPAIFSALFFTVSATLPAQTTALFQDSFDIGGDSVATGFGVDGVNTPSPGRFTGTLTASNSFQYYLAITKASTAYSIVNDQLDVDAAPNAGIVVLSNDGSTAFDFSTDLGIGGGTINWGINVDFALQVDATNGARTTITVGSNANSLLGLQDFGIQLDDDESDLPAGDVAVYFRTDAGNHSGAGDINQRIGVLAGRAGEIVSLNVTFNDNGDGSASTFVITANSGPESLTVTSADIFTGGATWNFTGASREIGLDTAPNEAATYDNLQVFTTTVAPTIASLSADPDIISVNETAATIFLDWEVANEPSGSTYQLTADKAVTFPDLDDTGDFSGGTSGSIEATVDGSLGDTTFTFEVLDGATVVATAQAVVTAVSTSATLTADPETVPNNDTAAPVTLDWTADNLPDLADYEILASNPVTFPNSDDTGFADSGAGSVDVLVNGTLGETTFTINIIDADTSDIVATAQTTVGTREPFDSATDERFLYFIDTDGDIHGFTGIDTGTLPVTLANDYSDGHLEATHLDYGTYQAFTLDPGTGIVYGIDALGAVVTWPDLASWIANTGSVAGVTPVYGAANLDGSIHGASFDPNTGGFYVVYESLTIDGDVGEYANVPDFTSNTNAVVTPAVYGGNILNFYYWGDDAPGNFGAATPGARYFQASGAGQLEGFPTLAEYINSPNNRTYQVPDFCINCVAAFAIPFPVVSTSLDLDITAVNRNPSGDVISVVLEFTPVAETSYTVSGSPDLTTPFSTITGLDNVTTSPITVNVPAGYEEHGYFRLSVNP
ncbi:MAG: hypothetical protein AAGA58_19130 [Verrucomicrobiota bacterium]